jgi:streptogramin lyase
LANSKPGSKSGIIIFLFFILILFYFTLPVWADTFHFEETPLYPEGSAASIHIGPDGRLFVMDDATELWAVNSVTGGFIDYFPVGSVNLADIAFSSAVEVWWTNNERGFGVSDLSNFETVEWYIPSDTFIEDPNLGPIAVYDNKIWLPTWFTSAYGLFQFDPTSKELCLFPFSTGIFAADIVVFNDQLWMLDWRGDGLDNQLFAFTPATGFLVSYPLGRNAAENAFIFVDNGQLWWAEDTVDGAIIRFIPGENNQAEMTVYSLPSGTRPRNLFVQQGHVWYSDSTGTFGKLDTGQVSGSASVINGVDVGVISSTTCTNLGSPEPYPFSIYGQGTFSWSSQDSIVDTTQFGLQIYELPVGSEAFGIAVQNDYIWVSDAGRQKLIRMPLPDILPEITVSKSAQVNSVPETGGDVSFTFFVENIGVEDVTLTSLSDSVFGDLNGQDDCATGGLIAIGGSYRCSITKFLASDSLTDHYNIVTAVGTDDGGMTDIVTDGETVTFDDVAPDITVTKTANPTLVPEAGGYVTFTFLVENIGVEDVTLTSLSDSVFGDLNGQGDCLTGGLIALGGSYSCSIQKFLVSESLTDHYNIVTAVGTDDDGTTDTATDNETVIFDDVAPGITVTKTANPKFVPEAGGDVSFTFIVSNISSEKVEITSLSDDKFGSLLGDQDCMIGSTITGGASCSFEVIFTIPPGNSAVVHENIFTAIVKDPQGNYDIATDHEIITYIQDQFKIYLPLLQK